MTYNEIKLGAIFEFKKIITKKMVKTFAELSGDFNKLHIDEDFGVNTDFGQNVVHGMLAGSFFSTLVGMYCPGENSLYLSQTLNFKKPIFYNNEVLVRGTVINKYDAVHVVELKTEIINNDKVLIAEEIKV